MHSRRNNGLAPRSALQQPCIFEYLSLDIFRRDFGTKLCVDMADLGQAEGCAMSLPSKWAWAEALRTRCVPNTPKTMKKDLLLAIDVGTGSVRAALINLSGETVAFSAREHDQIVPQFGWSEQRPESWWEGAVASVRTVLGKIESVLACRSRSAAICARRRQFPVPCTSHESEGIRAGCQVRVGEQSSVG